MVKWNRLNPNAKTTNARPIREVARFADKNFRDFNGTEGLIESSDDFYRFA